VISEYPVPTGASFPWGIATGPDNALWFTEYRGNKIGRLGLPSASSFYTVAPCRIVDTRQAAGPLGGPALSGGTDRIFVLIGACDVPADAKAISLNLTVVGPNGNGDLRLYPAGSARPLVSAINYAIGQTRANNAVAALGAGGDVAVRCDQPGGTTVQLILDVNGYFK
jgi:hypothetical protein